MHNAQYSLLNDRMRCLYNVDVNARSERPFISSKMQHIMAENKIEIEGLTESGLTHDRHTPENKFSVCELSSC